MKLTRAILIMFRAALILVLCAVAPTVGGQKTASVQDAEQFMNNAESRVAEISVKVNRADWVHSNFITEDTEALAAEANDELTAVTTDLVQQAKQFDGLQMPPNLARKFMLLRLSLTAPAPKDPKLRRDEGILEIRQVWWEPGVRLSKGRKAALESAVERLARLVGAERWEVARTDTD